MRVKRRKTMALLAAVSIVCAQSTVSDVFAAGAEEVAAQENNAVSIEYLTLQPGERDDLAKRPDFVTFTHNSPPVSFSLICKSIYLFKLFCLTFFCAF